MSNSIATNFGFPSPQVYTSIAIQPFSGQVWQENGCVAIDVYTCGEGNPRLVVIELLKYLNSDNYNLREVTR